MLVRRFALASIVAVSLASSVMASPIRFTDVSDAAGVHFVHDPDGADDGTSPLQNWWGPGVGWFDHNRDGLPDLYVANGETGNALFLNNGDGTFWRASEAVGLAGNRVSNGIAVADLQNDGRTDLGVANFHGEPWIFVRTLDSYANVAFSWGVQPVYADRLPEGMGLAFGDVDRNGLVDLYLANHRLQPDVLYRNLGGLFQKVDLVVPGAWGFQPVFLDFDDDGDQDIYVANDFGLNFLLENLGPALGYELIDNAGIYRVAGGGPGEPYSMSMGVAVGDFDNDGDLDIYVTNYFANALYENRMSTVNRFVQRAETLGARFDQNCWGVDFADLDLDGHLDLIQASGYIYSDNEALAQPLDLPNKVWRNNRNGTFTDVSDSAGFNDRGMGRGLATADFDRDGDLDVAVGNNTMDHPDLLQRFEGRLLLYRNDQVTGHHWVGLRLVGGGEHGNGLGCNRAAIGARVTVTAGGITQMRELRAGSSYLSQNYLEANFGIGQASVVDEVRVRWVCGAEEVFTGVTPDTYWRLVEGNAAAQPVSVALAGLDAYALGVGIQLDWTVSAPNQVRSTRIERARAGQSEHMTPLDLRVEYVGVEGHAFDGGVEPGVAYTYRIEIETYDGDRLTSGLVEASLDGGPSPRNFPRVGQNFPNPFNPSTTILVELPRATQFTLALHDDRGRLVRELYAGALGPGTHALQWDGRDDAGLPVASGTYRYVLRTPGRTSWRSLTLVR